MSKQVIDSYLSDSPEFKENANNSKSYSGLEAAIAEDAIKTEALANYYPSWVGQRYKDGDFHVHNLTKALIPYCFGADLLMLLNKGFICDRIKSKPAKHIDTAVDHMINFAGTNQQEWAGAQAFSHVNTLLAPLSVGEPYSRIKQSIQRLIWNANIPARSGYQTVFLNLIFDFHTPKMLSEVPVIIGGKDTGNTYADYEDEAEKIHLAFWEVMNEGLDDGIVFTFPIPTVNITKDTKWNSPVMDAIMENTAKLGQSYFMNYAGTGIEEDSVQAMCCRIALALNELAPAGGRWAMEGGTGSLGVVTLNMARLGYLAKSDVELFESLGELMERAKEILLRKEEIVTASKDVKRIMPMARFYNIDFNRFFRTIGLLGFDEMFLNYTGKPMIENMKLAEDILEFMRMKTREFQLETHKLFNFEMTPAEGSCWTMAMKDKRKYPDIKTQGYENGLYYTAMIPPQNSVISLNKMLDVSQILLGKFSGGTVCRINIDEKQPDVDSVRKFVRNISFNYTIPYFDLSAILSTCTTEKGCGHKVRGSYESCPVCGEPMEINSRVVGYYRPKQSFNPGKLSEFAERVLYNI